MKLRMPAGEEKQKNWYFTKIGTGKQKQKYYDSLFHDAM